MTSARATFLLCSNMTTMNAPAFGPTLTSLSDFAAWCPKLTSLDLSSSDLSGVQTIFHLVIRDADMTSVALPIGSTLALSASDAVNKAFAYCTSLTKISGIEAINTASLTQMEGVFCESSSLSTINISGWSAASCTSQKEMFDGCTALSAITVGANWKWIDGGYLPTPSTTYIATTDGKWHDSKTNTAYEPSKIPSNVAATYVAFDTKYL